MERSKADIERLLEQGQSIQIKPQGYSMYPMFVPGRDEAILEKADCARLRKGDVVLYRRDGGILVLHRICKIREGAFYMVGDNQKEVEGPLRPDQIKGVLTGFIRNGKLRSVKNPVYLAASRLWLLLRPVRPVLAGFAAAFKRVFISQKTKKRL